MDTSVQCLPERILAKFQEAKLDYLGAINCYSRNGS